MTIAMQYIDWREFRHQDMTPTSQGVYRGLEITVAETGGTIIDGRWQGYLVSVEAPARLLSLDELKTRAIGIADDLIAKGWQPR